MNNFNFLLLIYFFNFLLVINIIFKKNTNPQSTLTWLIVLISLPLVGLFFYLFFGRCTNFDTQIKRKKIEDKKIDDSFQNILQQDFCNIFNNDCKNYNEIYLFFNGNKKFESLFSDIKKAKHFVHIQYYIFKNDKICIDLIKLLNKKATEGVKVYLLLDYMGTFKTNKKIFKNLNNNFHISFFKLNILSRFNIHNHRKVCIIDGNIGYIGGFNIGEEYLGKSQKFKFWRDIHMKVVGDTTYSLQKSFIKDWNFANKYKTNQLSIEDKYFPKHNIKKECTTLIFTSGIDTKSYIYFYFNYLISSAKKSIYIQTPYFIPNETILDNLKIASLRNIDIKIIVPKEKDHPFVKYANLANFNELVHTDINLYHYEHGFLHSKLIIIDDELASVGSANMDYRSLKINFEISSIIFDKSVTKQLKKQFLDDLQNSKLYSVKDYNSRSKLTIIKENISKLISPLL